MQKKIYILLILIGFMGCGGGSTGTTSELQNSENNSTSSSNTEEDINNILSDTVSIENGESIEEENTEVPNDTNAEESTETANETTNSSTDNTNEEENTEISNDTTEEESPDIASDTTNTSDNDSIDTNSSITTTNGKAQLGVLSKATVKLYELNKLERKLLATTLTSEGDSIESIGNFNLYLEKLDNEMFYLYEITGGTDFDVNDDGIIDEQGTINHGTFHLLVLGSHIKSIQKANVTVISEIIYQKLITSLSLDNNELTNQIESLAQELIQTDINGDGFVGIEDVLKYNPISDQTKLSEEYQNKLSQVINDILNNQDSDLIAPIFENNNTEIQINENLTFIQKIEITDISTMSIKLLGTDARNFTYNETTQELSFLSVIDFENPQDNNKDNIFELNIEATDSYFNISNQNIFIQVLDVNETILRVPTLKSSTLSINENNGTNILIGTVLLEDEGTTPITTYTLSGEDSQFFTIFPEGEIFSTQNFDYETKNNYIFNLQASNSIGESNEVEIQIQINDIADITPIVLDKSITIPENRSIGSFIGQLNISSSGDSNISGFNFYGSGSNKFQADTSAKLTVLSYLDYESTNLYYLQYTAYNDAGESERANLTIHITNIFENSGSDYPKTENGIQNALDNTDYSFVLNQLLNNRDAYPNLDDDTVNMNIAGAYVGSSGYTVFDITAAMSEGNTSNFNDFVNNITEDNDAVSTISKLNAADTYYSNIVQGLDCTDTTTLTQIEEDSCYNLGLVRLTSLTNSVKLLFGGDADTVQKWANGVDINSSDDLNGNSVLDNSEAAACAVVYANDPNDSCQDGTFHSYKGKITFNQNGIEHNLTLVEVDVGNSSNGYQSFYQLVSANANNNTPILTSGTCDKDFKLSTNAIDGKSYFPCPTLDDNGDVMGIKQSLEQVANIQDLFPDGDETKTTVEDYLENITGSSNGTIGLDNLSTYLRTN
ncbi:MAG: Unknown protein [uncultured Sulfurovum sp.]|uniref:Cadherin domain-containing protein n=1 Tax=uncultured Sulfurovum sp. TaxID=269237 RepID=A0A6S6TB74_9BACT|nr:MAG: Unknown protein [uncultured Sulfurovum sp.]